MAIISKKNLLVIILIVLIIINVVALATFFFWPHHRFDSKDIACKRDKQPSEFLKKELNLNDAQSIKMDQLRKEHLDTLGFWADKMREKRNLLTTEMMKTAPDSTLLFSTCDEIGDIYAAIRKLNVLHYWQMKNVCDSKQQKKLDTVFKGIFCCEDRMMGRFGTQDFKGACPKNKENDGCSQHSKK